MPLSWHEYLLVIETYCPQKNLPGLKDLAGLAFLRIIIPSPSGRVRVGSQFRIYKIWQHFAP